MKATTLTLPRSFAHFAADIKLAHSIFALPFAIAALVVGQVPLPTASQAALLLAAMVGARSFAMGMNRYLDRHIDASNPRTVGRKIPSGALSARAGLAWSLASGAILILCASLLSPLAGYCAVPLLLILMSYSWMKRLSWLTHWYLGACLGLAPIAAQIAMTGTVTLPVVLLGVAVTLWTAGFDILYSLQDLEFDRSRGLHSVPGVFGPAKSLWISRVSFAGMIASLGAVGVLSGLGIFYAAGVALVAGILVFEQWLVRDARIDGRSARIGVAFFNANAYVSIVFLAFVLADRVLG
jgi:4-hydroxybenzoate polyprenyltransferase